MNNSNQFIGLRKNLLKGARGKSDATWLVAVDMFHLFSFATKRHENHKNPDTWRWRRIISMASSALSTQMGISTSSGLMSGVSNESIELRTHSMRPGHNLPTRISGI